MCLFSQGNKSGAACARACVEKTALHSQNLDATILRGAALIFPAVVTPKGGERILSAGEGGRAFWGPLTRSSYLVLLLLGQLHLLPLLLHLRGSQLLLLLVGRQELLPQAAQLADHAHELALFLRQAVCGTWP